MDVLASDGADEDENVGHIPVTIPRAPPALWTAFDSWNSPMARSMKVMVRKKKTEKSPIEDFKVPSIIRKVNTNHCDRRDGAFAVS